MSSKEIIIKKIKSLDIVKELNVTEKEIEKLFASFNTYINLNKMCNDSKEDVCFIHHYTYIRNPKTNNLIEVKCYCEKQKKINELHKRILYCTNKENIFNLIKKENNIKDIQYQIMSSNANEINASSINSKGLYIYGDPYIGKTEFLYLLLREFYNKTNGSICCINSKDLFEKLQNRQDYQKEISQIINVDALFIDNFGLEKWPKNYLFEEEFISFLQERLNAQKSNFISAAMSISELNFLYKSRKIHKYKINFIIETIKKLTNDIEIKLIKIVINNKKIMD